MLERLGRFILRRRWAVLAATLAAVGLWFGVYALLALLAPGRQFWHDRLCGTRLVPAGEPRVRPRPR